MHVSAYSAASDSLFCEAKVPGYESLVRRGSGGTLSAAPAGLNRSVSSMWGGGVIIDNRDGYDSNIF